MLIASLMFGCASNIGCRQLQRPTSIVAVYDNVEFYAADHVSFSEFGVAIDDNLPDFPLYMRFKDRGPVLLSELTEEQFAAFTQGDDDWERTLPDTKYYGTKHKRVDYSIIGGMGSTLMFADGKLEWASLREMDKVFSFSRTLEGPYYPLGLDKAALKKAFGKPTNWENRRRGGV